MRITIFLVLFLISASAQAYVGPGLGLGALGAIIAVLATILLAVFGLLWYPIKRLLRKKKMQGSEGQESKLDDENRDENDR
eukprot:UN34256